MDSGGTRTIGQTSSQFLFEGADEAFAQAVLFAATIGQTISGRAAPVGTLGATERRDSPY